MKYNFFSSQIWTAYRLRLRRLFHSSMPFSLTEKNISSYLIKDKLTNFESCSIWPFVESVLKVSDIKRRDSSPGLVSLTLKTEATCAFET